MLLLSSCHSFLSTIDSSNDMYLLLLGFFQFHSLLTQIAWEEQNKIKQSLICVHCTNLVESIRRIIKLDLTIYFWRQGKELFFLIFVVHAVSAYLDLTSGLRSSKILLLPFAVWLQYGHHAVRLLQMWHARY